MALPQWRNVSANVGNGAGYFGQGASLINQAFKTAQDGISKYQEQEKENANTREANNTAKLLDIAKTRPLTQADYDVAGMVDRTTLNKMLSEQEKQAHDKSMDTQKMGLDGQRLAAQIANWQSGINKDNAYIKNNTLENQLASYGAKLALDKKFGVGKSSKSSSGKKGSKSKGTNYDPFKMNEYIETINHDNRSKDDMRLDAAKLADAGFGNQEIMEELRNGTTRNYVWPNALGGDSGEYATSSDPDWLSKVIERRKIRKGL